MTQKDQENLMENSRIRFKSLLLVRLRCCDFRCSLNLWLDLRRSISLKIVIESEAMILAARKTA